MHPNLYLLFFLLIAIHLTAQEDNLTLHYDKPAEVWTEALPIGNSFMGGMIFGGVHQEHIQLNESTLYSGDPQRKYQGFNIRENYPEIIELINAGKYAEGQELIRKHWLGRPQDLYQPMSDLWIEFDHPENLTEYRRSLDIINSSHHVKLYGSVKRCGWHQRRNFIDNNGTLDFRCHASPDVRLLTN